MYLVEVGRSAIPSSNAVACENHNLAINRTENWNVKKQKQFFFPIYCKKKVHIVIL